MGNSHFFCTVPSVTFVRNEFLPSIACNSQDEPFSFSLQLKLYSRNLNKSKKVNCCSKCWLNSKKIGKKASRTGRPVRDAKKAFKVRNSFGKHKFLECYMFIWPKGLFILNIKINRAQRS